MNNIRRAGRYGYSVRNCTFIHNIRYFVSLPNIDKNISNDQILVKPRIRPDLFTGKGNPRGRNYKDLPIDTYPNPLFNMNKDEIIELNSEDYLHLLTIPYKSISETDKFCFHIIEIVNDLIILDSKKAMKLLTNITDEEISSIILNTLRKYFLGDRVKGSLLEFMASPVSKTFREGFFNNVSHILDMKDKTQDEKAVIFLSFLNKLALVGSINTNPLILNQNLYDKIIALIPESRYAEFYSYLVNLNIQTYKTLQLDHLKYKLIMGSNMEKFVARTGWMDPKWHDVERPSFDETHQQKMIQFFTIKDLKTFALFAVKKEDIVDATLYLNLLVSKFESKCKERMNSDAKDGSMEAILMQDIQSVLNVILSYIMVFKGSKSCIKVLKYIVKNHLEVKFENLLTIMNNLRAQGYYQEALLLMNNIQLEGLSRIQILALVEEILQLIKEKYPKSPKIIIGYVASIFNGTSSDIEKNPGLELLDDLRLLGIAYSGGEIGKLTQSLSIIQKANVDKSLTGFNLTPKALTEIYATILSSLPKSQITPELMFKLYEAYIAKIKDSKDLASIKNSNENNQQHIFHDSNLNDHVITLFIKHLLKINPNLPDMDLVATKSNFETAKLILDDFLGNTDIKRKNRSVYLFDLLIYSSLLVHQDYAFASKMIRTSRSYGLPFSFNQIYPFIMFHYYRSEYKQAEMWYRELIRHGVRAKASPAKTLFKVARELNWDVNGFVYRKFGIYKNHKMREEMAKLQSDPVLFIEDDRIDDELTEELIDAPFNNNNNDFNFSDELVSVLYQADLAK